MGDSPMTWKNGRGNPYGDWSRAPLVTDAPAEEPAPPQPLLPPSTAAAFRVAPLLDTLHGVMTSFLPPPLVNKEGHKPKGPGGGQFVAEGGSSGGGTAAPAAKSSSEPSPPDTAPLRQTPSGKAGSAFYHKKALAAAQALATHKYATCPKPTDAEVKAANERMDKMGADDYEANIRGGSPDRAASRKKLLGEFGDGTHCPCVYCGVKLDDGSVTRDKLYVARQGGKYRHSNLVPACLACNKTRSDTPFEETGAHKAATRNAAVSNAGDVKVSHDDEPADGDRVEAYTFPDDDRDLEPERVSGTLRVTHVDALDYDRYDVDGTCVDPGTVMKLPEGDDGGKTNNALTGNAGEGHTGWVTIRGHHVFLDGGRVTKGPPELVGRSFRKKGSGSGGAGDSTAEKTHEPPPEPAKHEASHEPAAPHARAEHTPESVAAAFKADHKTNLSRGKMSDADFARTAAALHEETSRLRAAYPLVDRTLKGRASRGQDLKVGEDFAGETGSGKGASAAYTYGQGIRLGATLLKDHEAPHYGGHSVSGGSDLRTQYRHELAHEVFDSPQGMSGAKRSDWSKAAAKYVGTSRVSRYGGTNASELFSESFAAYSSPHYKRGDLPPEIEKWFDRNLGHRPTTNELAEWEDVTDNAGFTPAHKPKGPGGGQFTAGSGGGGGGESPGGKTGHAAPGAETGSHSALTDTPHGGTPALPPKGNKVRSGADVGHAGGGDITGAGGKGAVEGKRYRKVGRDLTYEGVPKQHAGTLNPAESQEVIKWHDGMTMVGKNAPNAKLPQETHSAPYTDLERGALQKYSYLGDGPTNAMLRGRATTNADGTLTYQKTNKDTGQPEAVTTPYPKSHYDELHAALSSAFEKTPVMKDPVTVVRGMNLPESAMTGFKKQVEEAMRTGGQIGFAGYTSTAAAGGLLQKLGLQDPTASIPKAFKGNVALTIAATHGIDMGPHSQLPGEAELLLPHNSSFKVKKVTNKGGVMHVHLEQVPHVKPTVNVFWLALHADDSLEVLTNAPSVKTPAPGDSPAGDTDPFKPRGDVNPPDGTDREPDARPPLADSDAPPTGPSDVAKTKQDWATEGLPTDDADKPVTTGADGETLTPDDLDLLRFYEANPDAADKWVDTDADFVSVVPPGGAPETGAGTGAPGADSLPSPPAGPSGAGSVPGHTTSVTPQPSPPPLSPQEAPAAGKPKEPPAPKVAPSKGPGDAKAGAEPQAVEGGKAPKAEATHDQPGPGSDHATAAHQTAAKAGAKKGDVGREPSPSRHVASDDDLTPAANYDPAEARDEKGEWTKGGGHAGHTGATVKGYSAVHDPEAWAKAVGLGSAHDFARIIGAQPGWDVRVRGTTPLTAEGDRRVVVTAYHDATGANCERFVTRKADGSLHVVNANFSVGHEHQGKGIGAKVFSEQVEACRALGVREIHTTAGGDGPTASKYPGRDYMRGYYVWPRMGYDGKIPGFLLDDARAKFPGAETVLDVVSKPGGMDWWKKNGEEFKATFDLRDGSRSMAVHRAYLEEKAKLRAGGGPTKNALAVNAAGDGSHEEPDLSPDDEDALDAAWEKLVEGGGPTGNAGKNQPRDADGRWAVLSAVLKEHAAMPAGRAKSHVDAELWNAGVEDPTHPPKDVDPAKLARRLASAYADLHDRVPPPDLEHVAKMLGHAGVEVRHAPGDAVPFDGSVHEGPAGLFTSDRVTVQSPALLHGGRVLVKARVTAAGPTGNADPGNCGDGAGGFKPGNSCGGGGAPKPGEKGHAAGVTDEQTYGYGANEFGGSKHTKDALHASKAALALTKGKSVERAKKAVIASEDAAKLLDGEDWGTLFGNHWFAGRQHHLIAKTMSGALAKNPKAAHAGEIKAALHAHETARELHERAMRHLTKVAPALPTTLPVRVINADSAPAGGNCGTGAGGFKAGNSCAHGSHPPSAAHGGLPKPPVFVSSNLGNVKENVGAVKEMMALASAGDKAGLEKHPGTGSPKVQAYKAALLAHLGKHGTAPSAPEPGKVTAGHHAAVTDPAAPVVTEVVAPKPSAVSPTVTQTPHDVVHSLAAAGLNLGQFYGHLTGDASPYGSGAKAAEARRKITDAVLQGGHGQQDAVLKVLALHDPAAVKARVESIGEGKVENAVKEYANTPLYDLNVLSKITVQEGDVPGKAVCNMGSRSVKMGTTSSVTGDYRHELGHAVHAALGGAGLSGGSAVNDLVNHLYAQAMEKVKADPSGVKTKLSHAEYESKYGVVSRRCLDNAKELFAEQYRVYHREVYRDLHEGGGGKFLAEYRHKHPEWARIWDAHYTTALLGLTGGTEGKS